MRRRTVVLFAGVAVAVMAAFAAAVAVASPPNRLLERAVEQPIVIPQGLAWRYAQTCVFAVETVGVTELRWNNEGADAEVEATAEPGVDTEAIETQIETCLEKYRYEERPAILPSDADRAQLYDFYTGVTLPCLAYRGIDVHPEPRELFFAPVGEPWNPYLGMEQPIDRLLELYEACPPVPAYLGEAGAG